MSLSVYLSVSVYRGRIILRANISGRRVRQRQIHGGREFVRGNRWESSHDNHEGLKVGRREVECLEKLGGSWKSLRGS